MMAAYPFPLRDDVIGNLAAFWSCCADVGDVDGVLADSLQPEDVAVIPGVGLSLIHI